jgi:two-component system, cell cycle sensor histidine kinase and response regulator CckA
MFIPFVTTKGERSGTGLGLAVVYGIIAGHHGFIDVKSAVGQGTTFEIFLPRTERKEAEKPEKAGPSVLPQGRGRILVVDDEPQVREVISRILTACGYAVVLAENGREALSRFAQGGEIDLVLLDMVMPDMGGRECLARLRKADPKARVLIATGYTADGSAQELLREGALAIVEKPLDLAALTEKIGGILEGSGAC